MHLQIHETSCAGLNISGNHDNLNLEFLLSIYIQYFVFYWCISGRNALMKRCSEYFAIFRIITLVWAILLQRDARGKIDSLYLSIQVAVIHYTILHLSF